MQQAHGTPSPADQPVSPPPPVPIAAVRLDTTLADLYRACGITGPFVATMHCVFAHIDLHPVLPRERLFPEDAEPLPHGSGDEPELARLRALALGLKPLRRAFALGDMAVLFWGCGGGALEAAVARALRPLAPAQRPRPRFVDLDAPGFAGRRRAATASARLLFWRPQGWMEAHACVVRPRAMFDVNSKRFLLTAGIRTPAAEVVALRGAGGGAAALVAAAAGGGGGGVFGTQALPFVAKLPRAGCGAGTFIVKTEAQRRELLAALAAFQARGTRDVILQRYVEPAEELSAHFVVGAPGTAHDRRSPLVVAVTVQTLAPDGTWAGGRIDYRRQGALRARVWATVQDTARRLPAAFVGWAGVDIVEDGGGEQWVVDLNARITGSMPICLLSGHFWEERGLPLAQLAAVEYAGGVHEIYERLQPLVGEGVVIVIATVEIKKGVNMADVIWGGKDTADLAEVEKWMRDKLAEA